MLLFGSPHTCSLAFANLPCSCTQPCHPAGVFRCAHAAPSAQGKRLLRSWMLRPVADLATIQDRQDTVQLLVDARDVAAALQGILKKVRVESRAGGAVAGEDGSL